MEEEKMSVKEGGSRKVLLGIIFVLVIGLIALAIYMFVNKPNTKNIYFKVFDEFAANINKTIDKMPANNVEQMKYDVSFNLNSSSNEYREIAKILNKIKLSSIIESDLNNKKANVNLDVIYNNNSIVNGNIYLNNKDLYAEVPSLYSKLIKLPLDDELDMEYIWNAFDKDNYKTITSELTKIIKNNLKDEYFSNNDETINVLNKDVLTNKQVFKLSKDSLKELITNVINDIQNNTKLLNSLSKAYNISVDEVKNELNNYKLEMDITSGFEIDLFLNKKNNDLEYATIIVDDEKLELLKTEASTFNIVVDKDVIGNIVLKDNDMKASINYDGIKMSLKATDNLIEMKNEQNDLKISVKIVGNENKGSMEANVESLADKIELKLNADFEVNKIKSITQKDYSNYIEADKITENEMNEIMTKLYENQNLMTLIQDVSSLFNAQAY